MNFRSNALILTSMRTNEAKARLVKIENRAKDPTFPLVTSACLQLFRLTRCVTRFQTEEQNLQAPISTVHHRAYETCIKAARKVVIKAV